MSRPRVPSPLKVYFDGGCRPNPGGAMELAVVGGGQTHIVRDLGQGTNTDAEWLALIHALTVAQTLGTRDFVLLGDSANVIAQANGVAKSRGANIGHLDRFRAMAAADGPPRVRHIKRTQNLAGIALARLHV